MADASTQPVVTRFAPSPTGALHVGGARTALFNWAFARRHGGRFVLRIEDTDAQRSTAEAAQGIIRDLAWLGLDWDEGPDPKATNWDAGAHQLGEHGPYFQSQRGAVYREYLEKLHQAGRTYADDGAVRFRMPTEPITVTDAVLGDVTAQPDQPQMRDFVVMKSDGNPTYHFAVVVDDALMGVNHVIRGQEHLDNTIKHVALQAALGFDQPTYAHIPLIFNPDGSKMSKRDKAKAAREAGSQYQQAHDIDNATLAHKCSECVRTFESEQPEMAERIGGIDSNTTEERIVGFMQKEADDILSANLIAIFLEIGLPEIEVDDFRRTGYLPEVICNYLALLGWNPGGDVERFGERPLEFLAQNFSLDRVQKGSAKFDRDKLYAFNHEYIAELPAETFKARLREHFAQYHPEFEAITQDDTKFAKFAEAYQPRCHVLSEPAQLGRFFVQPPQSPEDYDGKAVKKNLSKNEGEGFDVLRALRDRLENLDPFTGEAAHEALQAYAEENSLKMGKVAQPLRVALTGNTVSPPIDVTLELMGRDETIKRIDACLQALGAEV